MEAIAEAFNAANLKLKQKVQLMFQSRIWDENEEDIPRRTQVLNATYWDVVKIENRYPGLVAGFYAETVGWKHHMEIFKKVVDPSRQSNFLIGGFPSACENFLNGDYSPYFVLSYYQSLSFIVCTLVPKYALPSEINADMLMDKCGEYAEKAKNLHITAKIYCQITYPSHGLFGDGIKGTIEGYEKFWCRIFARIKNAKSPIFEIIMNSAFDYTPAAWGENITTAAFDNEINHRGWWKRIHETSIEGSAFFEKVDCKTP